MYDDLVLRATNSVEINQKAKKVTLLLLMSLLFMTGLTFEKEDEED